MTLRNNCLAIAALGLAVIPGAYAADDNTWALDTKHSAAHFSVKHMMVSTVRGDFSKVTGKVNYDGKDLKGASVEATIDTTTLNTQEPGRDEHVKGKDFLDVAQFPTMTFKSEKIVKESGGAFKIVGKLTLHGVTKDVTLDAEPLSAPIKDMHGKTRTGTSTSASIKRKDYGVNFNGLLDNGGAVVGDDVRITIDVELIKG